MKLGLINSAWLGSPVGTADGIRHTKEIGFDTIDISADPLDEVVPVVKTKTRVQ
jgi:D-psicose/D-tagatose/L-ribulose 3-epimerase